MDTAYLVGFVDSDTYDGKNDKGEAQGENGEAFGSSCLYMRHVLAMRLEVIVPSVALPSADIPQHRYPKQRWRAHIAS